MIKWWIREWRWAAKPLPSATSWQEFNEIVAGRIIVLCSIMIVMIGWIAMLAFL